MSAIATTNLTVDPHADWASRAAAIYAQTHGAEDDVVDRLTEAADVFERRIAETPAQTLAGAIEQLRCALRYGALAGEGVEGTAVRSALATLERTILGRPLPRAPTAFDVLSRGRTQGCE